MNINKKHLHLNFLLVLITIFWCRSALARTDFEMEVDFDADGICDSDFFPGPYYFCSPNPYGKPDNCPEDPNPDQADSDYDGKGDVCDSTPIIDSDDDGINNCQGGQPLDLCPPPPADLICDEVPTEAPNDRDPFEFPLPTGGCVPINLSETQDHDGDGIGNACDPDADNDGIKNEEDCSCLDPNVPGQDSSTCPGLDFRNVGGESDSAGGCSLVTYGKTETAEALIPMLILFMMLALAFKIFSKNWKTDNN